MTFDHRKYAAFQPIGLTDRTWPDRVIERAPDFCAVDLRDGNQALIKPMSIDQKVRLFDLLTKLGLKEIEIGFPAASQIEYDFCRRLIDEDRIPADVTVQVLVQAREELIVRTFEALRGIKRAIVHVYNSTSTVQRQQVFAMDEGGVIAIAQNGARWIKEQAAKHPETHWTFEYSPESFTGTELPFAVQIIDAVTDVWEPHLGQPVIINLPATVEMSTPNIFADQIEWVLRRIQHRSHLRVSLHTHNDRGCAIAAAELGLLAGADRIEGTLLGNGERTGNMDLVTFAMNLYSQGIDPMLNLEHMREVITEVEAITEIKTHPRHPYAGELVFTAFSGSHQDAIRKCLAKRDPEQPWDVAYLPIDPEDLGRQYEEVVRINSQSGKGGVAHVLERDYGIELPRWLQQEFSKVVQQEAERSGDELNTRRIRQLFEDHYLSIPKGWELDSYELQRTAEGVTVQLSTVDTPPLHLTGRGSGAVDALATALTTHLQVPIEVQTFDERALRQGTDAQALACIHVRVGQELVSTVAVAGDTTSAALQTLLSALGRVNALATTRPVEIPAADKGRTSGFASSGKPALN